MLKKKNEKWTHAERETYLLPPPQVIMMFTARMSFLLILYLKLNWVEYYSTLLPCNFPCKPNNLCAHGNVQSKILQPTLVDVGHYIFFEVAAFILKKICTPPGFYADPEAECQGYHVCMPLFGGNVDRKMSFLCPNGTIFNQELFVCDWW